MADLGNLWYSLGIKDNTQGDLQRIIQNISHQLANGGNVSINSVKLDPTAANNLVSQIQQVAQSANLQFGVDANALRGAIGQAMFGGKVDIAVSPIITQTEADKLKTSVEKAIEKAQLKDVKVTIDKIALQQSLQQQAYAINISCNQQQLNALLTALRNFLNGKQVYVKLTPSIPNKELNSLRNTLSQKLQNLKLRGVQLTVDRANAQADLNARPFTANLLLTINRAQLQAAINGQFALTAAQARGIRAGQQQRRSDDLHNESLLRQQRLRQSVNRSLENGYEMHKNISGQMKTTTQLATILGNTLGNVFSVYAVKSFLTEIVKVGGEIQKQNLAMQNILGDTFKAAENYQRIKNLAVISPFNVQDLTTYSRRLSAFGVEYNQLYDTMKRLADISAGVGTDFSRIALVYGETLERTFLDAKLLRQFSYAGVPMIQKLSELYTKRENAIVTGADVRKRITNREVSFEDVNEVIKNLTDEGGKFYQMQEVMADSLATKWNNVGVAMDIAFANMSDGTLGEALKRTAELLTALARNYEQVGMALSNVVIGMGAYKVHQMAVNRAVGEGTTVALKNALVQKRQAAIQAEAMASYYNRLAGEQLGAANAAKPDSARQKQLRNEYLATRRLIDANKELISTKGRLTLTDYRQMAVSGQLTKNQALMLLMTQERRHFLTMMEKRQLVTIMQTLNISKAELQAATSGMVMNRVMLGLSNTMKGLGMAMKTMLLNPITLVFMALEGAMALYTHFREKAEESERRAESIAEKAREGARNLDELMKSATYTVTPTGDAEFKTAIDEMKTALKDYAPDWQNTFADVFGEGASEGIKTQLEQYEALKDALYETREAYALLSMMKDVVESGNDASDGWFDEGMLDNLKDYQKELKNLDSTIREHAKNYERTLEFLAAAREKNGDFAAAVTNGDGSLKSAQEQLGILARDFHRTLNSMTTDMSDTTWRSFQWLNNAAVEVGRQWMVAKDDVVDAADEIEAQMRSLGFEPGNYSEGAKKALRMAIETTLNDSGITSEAARQLLYKELIHRQMIVDVKTNYAEPGKNFTQLQQDALNALGLTGESNSEGKTIYKDKTNDSELTKRVRQSVQQAIQQATTSEAMAKALKELRDDANKTIQRLAKAGSTTVAENKTNQEELDKANEILKQVELARAGAGLMLDKEKKVTSTKDPWKEQMSQRIKVAREAYDEFKKLVDVYHDEAKAIEEMKKGGVFAEFFKDSAMGSPAELRNNFEKLLDEVISRNDPKYDALRLELTKYIFGFDLDEVKRKASEAAAAMKEQLDRDVEQWNLYKKLFEASGDREWSKRMAGSGMQVWDELAISWKNQLENELGNTSTIDWGMDEKEAEKFFGSNGKLLALYLKTKERIEKNGVDLLGTAAEGLKSTDNLDARIKAITEEMDSALSKTQDATVIEGIRKQYNDQINQLKRELYEGSDVYKQLTQDTANLGMKKLNELRTLARGVRDAINGGTSQKDKNGNISYNFTYDQKEYNASENAVKSLLKLIEQLEKKADNATEAMKRLMTGKNSKGEAATFGEYAKDMSSVFGYFSQIVTQLQSFGGSSEFQTMAKVVGQVSNAMQSFSSAAEKFDAGDYAGGVNDSLSGAVALAEAAKNYDDYEWQEYKKKVGDYKALLEVWDSLIEKKMEYIKMTWGEDTKSAAQEAVDMLKTELAIQKELAKERLGAGSNWWGSHSYGYRMWEGSYESQYGDHKGKTWKDVAGEIESMYGVRFTQMSDLLEMDSDTLLKIKEEYPDMWAAMDTDFRQYLDAIIEYDDKLKEIENTVNEGLTNTSWDNLRSGFESLVKDMSSTWLDFVDNFEESLYNAIVNQKLTEILGNEESGPLAEYYKMFADYMASDNGLDDAEVADLRRKYDEIAKEVQKVKGEASATSGYKGGSSSSLSSSISGVSADEVGAMSAYLNGIRADASTINATAMAQLAQLNMQTEYLRIISERIVGCEEHMDTLKSDIHAVTNGTKSMSVK